MAKQKNVSLNDFDIADLKTLLDVVNSFNGPSNKGLTKNTKLPQVYQRMRQEKAWQKDHPLRDDPKKMPEFRMVRLGDLEVSPKLMQRDGVRDHIIKIADAFDWNMFGTVTVVRINGKYLVLDGQQRSCAALCRYNPDREVPCMVLRNLTIEEAAKVFLGINLTRRGVNRGAIHRAKVTSGDAWANLVEKFLKANKLYEVENKRTGSMFDDDFTGVSGPGNIDDMLYKWQKEQEELSKDPNYEVKYVDPNVVVSIYRQVFPKQTENQFSGTYLNGLAYFLYTWPDMRDLAYKDPQKLIKGLKRIALNGATPNFKNSNQTLEFLLAGSSGGGTPFHVAIRIAQNWNFHGCHSKVVPLSKKGKRAITKHIDEKLVAEGTRKIPVRFGG